jgi:uncharacterized integral membrane protein
MRLVMISVNVHVCSSFILSAPLLSIQGTIGSVGNVFFSDSDKALVSFSLRNCGLKALANGNTLDTCNVIYMSGTCSKPAPLQHQHIHSILRILIHKLKLLSLVIRMRRLRT